MEDHSLIHFRTICREAFGFLVADYKFLEATNTQIAPYVNPYVVRFENGAIAVQVIGEGYGQRARVQYVAPDGRPVPIQVLDPSWEPNRRHRKRLKVPLSQDAQIQEAAELIRLRDRQILAGDYAKLFEGANRAEQIPARFKPDYTMPSSVIRIAQQIAEEIVAGSISPYDGGRRIWKECQLRLTPGDHRLDPFVYWASEYEETLEPDRRALCDKAIRVSAEDLVKNGSAVSSQLWG